MKGYLAVPKFSLARQLFPEGCIPAVLVHVVYAYTVTSVLNVLDSSALLFSEPLVSFKHLSKIRQTGKAKSTKKIYRMTKRMQKFCPSEVWHCIHLSYEHCYTPGIGKIVLRK